MARIIEADAIRGVKVAENYIKRGTAESGNTNKWAVFADAAGTSPVDGTGGSPNSTLTVTSSNPLDGINSFLFTKNSGASRQGEGFSYDFTIPSCDQAKVLTIEFEYSIASGTYSDADMSVWIYDVTNAVMIQPSPYTILNTGLSATWQGTFQTASNSTSYRLIFFVGVSTNSANTVKFDRISISRQPIQYGAPVTDWVAYTPTFTGFGTVTGSTFRSRRVGDSLEVQGGFQAGTVTATGASITVGYAGTNANVTIDTAKAPGTNSILGPVVTSGYSATFFNVAIIAPNSNGTTVNFGVQTSTQSPMTPANGNVVIGSNGYVGVRFTVPILGWSSSTQMSSDADTKVIAARARTTGTRTPGPTKAINYDTVDFDTAGSITTVSGDIAGWKFTAPVPGYYQVSVVSYVSVTAVAALQLYVNGSFSTFIGKVSDSTINSGSTTVKLNVGDYLDIRSDGAPTMGNLTGGNVVTIQRISGPSQIAASETVAASYTGNTGQAITGTAAALTFQNKLYDTHGAFSGTTYTVPVSGKYTAYFQFATAGSAFTTTQAVYAQIVQAGSASVTRENLQYGNGGNSSHLGAVTADFNCIAGDTITFKAASDVNVNTGVSSNYNYFTIKRVGN